MRRITGLVRVRGGALYAPLMAAETIKAAVPKHERYWDSDGECWRIRGFWMEDAIHALIAAGYSIRLPGQPVRLTHRTIQGTPWE